MRRAGVFALLLALLCGCDATREIRPGLGFGAITDGTKILTCFWESDDGWRLEWRPRADGICYPEDAPRRRP